MTTEPKTLPEYIADFRLQLAELEAMPDTGSVLYCSETNLAICIPDGDADKGYISALQNAKIFSRADRSRPAQTPGLDRLYSDGSGRRFYLFDIRTAKRLAIETMTTLIKTLENMA